MEFIDTHAHLADKEFDEDRPEVVRRAREAGAIGVFLPNVNETTVAPMLKMCEDYPGFCHPMLGLHPEDITDDNDGVLARMETLLVPGHPFIAIGEVGLDFYWDASRKEEQMRVFDVQIQWSLRYGLPLMIHARSAHRELVNSLLPYKDKGITGVFHCFSGSRESAEELMRLFPDFCFGIGGVLTFKKAHLPETLTHIPLSRIVLETDAPYMAPVPNRGKRNESSFLPFVVEKLAEVYGVSAEEVAQTTTHNVERVFGFKKSQWR